VRRRRDGASVERALAALGEAARAYAGDADGEGSARPHLMPLIVDAVRARASVGEISETLAAVWGRYRPTA
jgi:methylmalonyl-CoA mutase, N-terminal domain